MPFIYDVSLATPAALTTNGTTNTETDTFSIKSAAGRDSFLKKLVFGGRANGVSVLSGIEMRMFKLATASTAGTGMTPSKKDPSAPAARGVCISRPTIGATRTNHGVYVCGVSTPGGFDNHSADRDSMMMVEAGAANSIDCADVCTAVSIPFSFSFELLE